MKKKEKLRKGISVDMSFFLESEIVSRLKITPPNLIVDAPGGDPLPIGRL